MDQQITDLTLLLIYLTGWEEDKKNDPGEKVLRAWIFHKYEILDRLENRGLIRKLPGGKSLTVTEQGKQEAEELKKKYRQ
ncbi:MAG: DUF6429 family protein [Candidatus Aminicenantes bacterium]|jgi:hypothetical protein